MTGRPSWTTKWGEDGLRYKLLTIRARALLAAAFASQRYTHHPWLEYDWEPFFTPSIEYFLFFLQAKYIAMEPGDRVQFFQLSKCQDNMATLRATAH